MQLNERHNQGRAGEVTAGAPKWLCFSEIYSGDGQKCLPETRCPQLCVPVNISWPERGGRMPTVLALGSRMARCPGRWAMPSRIIALHRHTFSEVQPFITQWDPGALHMWAQFRYSFITSHVISRFTQWGSAEVNAVNAILCSITITIDWAQTPTNELIVSTNRQLAV